MGKPHCRAILPFGNNLLLSVTLSIWVKTTGHLSESSENDLVLKRTFALKGLNTLIRNVVKSVDTGLKSRSDAGSLVSLPLRFFKFNIPIGTDLVA
ncbi:unnamed protein product [Ilex paraguariensis]|uniref:Uncharacterized protein n=1 Tax=Ilex paraguariensis TaxID=185542 RepID=A0ABC8TUQ7_9AQUA